MDPGTILPLFVVSFFAGFIGSMLGLGGGVVIVPAVTLLFNQDIHDAIGASLIGVIATSTSAAIVYLKHKLVNLRLSFLLLLTIIIGAPIGATLSVSIPAKPLEALFGAMMVYTGFAMIKSKISESSYFYDGTDTHQNTEHYLDKTSGEIRSYRFVKLPQGMIASFVSGLTSGMLGVGGGWINVPVMHLIMRVPMQAAVATSNYTLGITAAASAFIYYNRGFVKPMIVGPCALGVLIGAQVGSRVAQKVHSATLRWMFFFILLITAAQMLRKAFGL